MDVANKMYNLLTDFGYHIKEEDLAQDDIDLRDFVMDSMEFVTLIVEIENVFNIELPDEFLDFEILASLQGMIKTVEILKVQGKSEII